MDKFDPGKKRSDDEHVCQYHIKINRLYDAGQTAFIGLTFVVLFYSVADYKETFHGLSEIVAFIGKVVVPGAFVLATGQKLFLWYRTPSDEEEIKTVNRRNTEGADPAPFDGGGPVRPPFTREQAMTAPPPRTEERRLIQPEDEDLVRYAHQKLSQPGAGERLRQQRRQEFDQAWGIQPKSHSHDDT